MELNNTKSLMMGNENMSKKPIFTNVSGISKDNSFISK